MVKEIVTDIEQLSNRSDEINTRKEGDKFRAVLIDLKDTIIENNLPALSAPQIGVPIRVFTINFTTRRKSFINPLITSCKEFTFSREKSPVRPGKEFIVPRYNRIEAGYFDPLGKINNITLLGYAAFMFQQMVDSLEGILPSDIGLEIDEDFDKATDEEREELLKAYADSLEVRIKELREDIDKDPELKEIDSGINFIEAVQKGEVKLEHASFTDEEVEAIQKSREEKLKTFEGNKNESD